MLIPFSELIKKYDIQPKGVLHIGASTGQECEAYYSNGIEQSIWIEAIPGVFENLWLHVKDFKNVQVFNACIDEIEREVEFNISSNGGESSSLYEFGEHKNLHPDVTFVDKIKLRTTRVDQIEMNLDKFEYPFTFLNIDLQGAELSALKSMGTLLDNFQYIYIEVNKKETYKGCPLFEEVNEFLKEFELKEVKWIGDCWGDAFYIRK